LQRYRATVHRNSHYQPLPSRLHLLAASISSRSHSQPLSSRLQIISCPSTVALVRCFVNPKRIVSSTAPRASRSQDQAFGIASSCHELSGLSTAYIIQQQVYSLAKGGCAAKYVKLLAILCGSRLPIQIPNPNIPSTILFFPLQDLAQLSNLLSSTTLVFRL
jgi:hypothetical protein